MRMTKYKRGLACLIMLAFGLTGCGKKPVEVPELLAPSAGNESYRPVEYGDVGAINVAYGTVVPTEYCHFWLTQVTIKEISVDIGDYVQAGDILAYADIDAARETIEQLNAQLTLENSIFSVDEEIYLYKHQELELKRAGMQAIADGAAEAQAATDIAVLEENHRYDTLLHQYRVNELNESIAEQQEIVTDGTLVAQVSGYVTYTKDISSGGSVTNAENVVIVSDYENCYVEMTDITVSEDFQRNFMPYDQYYTEIAGKKYNLREYEYAPNELVVIEDKAMYPNMRMQFEDKSALPEAGTNIPVFMTGDIVEDVLVVGNDSLYQDSQGDFVYVKKDESRELRYVELGKSGDNYTEVISGLSEGEMVYYSSGAILPEQYTEFEVQPSDYEPKRTAETYTIENTKNKIYYSEYEGRITSLNVREGDAISAGDLVCTIQTNEGSARLAELSNAINELKQNYQNTEKGYADQIQTLENQMAALMTQQPTPEQQPEQQPTPQPEETATGTDAVPEDTGTTGEPGSTEAPGSTETSGSTEEPGSTETPPQDPNLYQELALQIEQVKAEEKKNTLNYNYDLGYQEAEYQKASQNNNGSGTINIYAETAGTVTGININEGKNVKAGDRMFNIGVSASDKVQFRSSDALHLNQTLVFCVDGSDKTYTGKISGITGDTTRVYVTTVDDKVYLTNNLSDSNTKRYYVKMDDETFYTAEDKCKIEYSVNSIKNTFVLPEGVVHSEQDEKGENVYYYVWRIVDGNLVKQYVTTTTDEYNGMKNECVINGLKAGDILAQDESK